MAITQAQNQKIAAQRAAAGPQPTPARPKSPWETAQGYNPQAGQPQPAGGGVRFAQPAAPAAPAVPGALSLLPPKTALVGAPQQQRMQGQSIAFRSPGQLNLGNVALRGNQQLSQAQNMLAKGAQISADPMIAQAAGQRNAAAAQQQAQLRQRAAAMGLDPNDPAVMAQAMAVTAQRQSANVNDANDITANIAGKNADLYMNQAQSLAQLGLGQQQSAMGADLANQSARAREYSASSDLAARQQALDFENAGRMDAATRYNNDIAGAAANWERQNAGIARQDALTAADFSRANQASAVDAWARGVSMEDRDRAWGQTQRGNAIQDWELSNRAPQQNFENMLAFNADQRGNKLMAMQAAQAQGQAIDRMRMRTGTTFDAQAPQQMAARPAAPLPQNRFIRRA